jgi:predicted dehydrogenase
VYRDDLFMLQVDGTQGSAVAGLTNCKALDRAHTPRTIWDPDVPNLIDFRDRWKDVPNGPTCNNAFRVEWELYLRSLAEGTHFVHDFWDGARGVQLAELALQSWKERRWIDVPPLQDGGEVAT